MGQFAVRMRAIFNRHISIAASCKNELDLIVRRIRVGVVDVEGLAYTSSWHNENSASDDSHSSYAVYEC